ncbi:MAG: glutamate--cysteine ligase, partial [Enterovibrio sp.]
MTHVDKLAQFVNCPNLLLSMGRGIEREGLRIDEAGALAQTMHPAPLGSALKNRWITTDFAEQLLEFITPVSSQSAQTLAQLSDIHKFTYQAMPNEKIWPLSMPCCVPNEEEIKLGHYGSSNHGKMKTLYRQGLKNRYGSMMQVISGVHFNFSFSKAFWQQLYGENLTQDNYQETVSAGYFALIRNYYRFGWLIPYLFGASPALCSSFLKRPSALPFKEMFDGTRYLPYATSLRLSDLGYTSHAQSGLDLSFNSLEQYVLGVRRALKTPSPFFDAIPVKNEQGYQQLNTNILQIENELYAPIRPKRVMLPGERPLQALESRGVEYIEVRSLDVNPFSPVGIDLL